MSGMNLIEHAFHLPFKPPCCHFRGSETITRVVRRVEWEGCGGRKLGLLTALGWDNWSGSPELPTKQRCKCMSDAPGKCSTTCEISHSDDHQSFNQEAGSTSAEAVCIRGLSSNPSPFPSVNPTQTSSKLRNQKCHYYWW